jgi:hypothetical protein
MRGVREEKVEGHQWAFWIDEEVDARKQRRVLDMIRIIIE